MPNSAFLRGGNEHTGLPEDPAMGLHSLGFPSSSKYSE